jgi:hypothetical protein
MEIGDLLVEVAHLALILNIDQLLRAIRRVRNVQLAAEVSQASQIFRNRQGNNSTPSYSPDSTRPERRLTFILAVVAELPELVMWIDCRSKKLGERFCVQQHPAERGSLGHKFSVSYDWAKSLEPHFIWRADSNVEHGVPTPVAGQLGGVQGIRESQIGTHSRSKAARFLLHLHWSFRLGAYPTL